MLAGQGRQAPGQTRLRVFTLDDPHVVRREHERGILRIEREPGRLTAGRVSPVRARNPVTECARWNDDRPGVLLPAIEPIWKLVICLHGVELCGRLVVDRTPRCSAVERDGGASI